MGETMKRHNWLIAVVTALFVLQTPLCALACSETAADPTIDVSCHEEGTRSSPAGESNSHADCGCDVSANGSANVLISQQIESQTTAPVGFSVVLATRSNAIISSRRQDQRIAALADLPPPDILLRKSTLLL